MRKIFLLILIISSFLFGIELSEKKISLAKTCSLHKTNENFEPKNLDFSRFIPNIKGIEKFEYTML